MLQMIREHCSMPSLCSDSHVRDNIFPNSIQPLRLGLSDITGLSSYFQTKHRPYRIWWHRVSPRRRVFFRRVCLVGRESIYRDYQRQSSNSWCTACLICILPLVRIWARSSPENRSLPPGIARRIDCSSQSPWYQNFWSGIIFFYDSNARILLSRSTLGWGNCTSVFNYQPKTVLRDIWQPSPFRSYVMCAASFPLLVCMVQLPTDWV